jgi:hypothetical protein
MQEIRCAKPGCPCWPKGRLLLKVNIPNPRGGPLGITIEVVCPYDKKRKLTFRF